MKIAVYAIALDEEKFARQFIASCREADHVLIADTGSTDGTVPRLKSLGAEVRKIRIDPWRFDTARNAALALVPQDIDVCVSLDLDQTLAPGWRALVEAAWAAGANQLFYTQVYTQGGATGEVTFLDNRIHARTGFAWRYPCHECLVPEPGTPDRALTQTRLHVLHAPDPAKSRANYLPLLELAVAERPDDPRCAHYLGREYHALGRHAEAARQFERYFALTSGKESFERNATLRLLAHCREALGDEAGALALFRAAVAEAPRMRGAWVSLAWAAHRRQAWPDCLDAAERAISLRDEGRNYGEDTSPGVLAEDLACLASWALSRPWTALDYARDALAKAPKSQRLQANLLRIEAALSRKGPQAFGVSAAPLANDVAGGRISQPRGSSSPAAGRSRTARRRSP